MVEDNLTLLERIKKLEEEKIPPRKVRKIRLPVRAKVRRARLKKGWVGILKVDENRNISAEKVEMEDSAYRTSDGTYHSVSGNEMLFWQGKYPILIQPTIKINPIDLVTGKNETRGQKLIQAKLLKDVIKIKKAMPGGILIFALIGAAVFVLGKFVFKWF